MLEIEIIIRDGGIEPEALLPPNGCWPTTDPVLLSLKYMLPAESLRMSRAHRKTVL